MPPCLARRKERKNEWFILAQFQRSGPLENGSRVLGQNIAAVECVFGQNIAAVECVLKSLLSFLEDRKQRNGIHRGSRAKSS